MAKCLIVYFSQKGATQKIANQIAGSLKEKGHEVDFHNLKDGKAPDVKDYDFIGIGSPTYYFQQPMTVKKYLDSLPELNQKPVFVFSIAGAYRGRTGNVIRKIIEKKGGKEIGYFKAKGADIVYLYLKEGNLYSPESPTDEELSKAKEFGQEVAEVFAGKEYKKPPKDKDVGFLFRYERFLAHPWFVKHLYSRLFKADKKKCIRCGKCMEVCPVNNIGKDKDGYPVFGRDCIACVMCQLHCPKRAITSAFDWKLFLLFIKLNFKRYDKDKTITCTKGKLENGQFVEEK